MKLADAIALARKKAKAKSRHEYYKNAIQIISFSESYGERTTHEEKITHNLNTGSIKYSSSFSGVNRQTLPVIDIE